MGFGTGIEFNSIPIRSRKIKSILYDVDSWDVSHFSFNISVYSTGCQGMDDQPRPIKYIGALMFDISELLSRLQLENDRFRYPILVYQTYKVRYWNLYSSAVDMSKLTQCDTFMYRSPWSSVSDVPNLTSSIINISSNSIRYPIHTRPPTLRAYRCLLPTLKRQWPAIACSCLTLSASRR